MSWKRERLEAGPLFTLAQIVRAKRHEASCYEEARRLLAGDNGGVIRNSRGT